jgi:heme O synthase-like polyprenyltransferase
VFWVQQKHHLNTWVGAVVGGLPPLIGYAAATGGALDMQVLLRQAFSLI